MRWYELKLRVLLLAAVCIPCTKADHVVDKSIVVADSINKPDEVFRGAEGTVNGAESSLDIFNNPDGDIEIKDNFQRSIHLSFEPVSDTAYWDSIYGTDDIPDFDTPPEIEGDSIILENIDEEVDDVDDVAVPFAKRSTNRDNLTPIENHPETTDYQWNANKKRSKEHTYRNDQAYWRNPFLPRYNEDEESSRSAIQFQPNSMTVHPEMRFRNDFNPRDLENFEIMHENNRPMRASSGIYANYPKYVSWRNIPESLYGSASTNAKAYAGSSKSNGGLSFIDDIAERSDAYAESEASPSGSIITGGPRLSLNTSPITESSNYYTLDDSDSSKVISSSTASAIAEKSGKSSSNYESRKILHLRPKHGMKHSHGVNLHKLSINQPGCSCSNKMIVGDQGAVIVSGKKSNIKQIVESQSATSKAHSSASSQVNLNQAVSTGSVYSGVKQNLGIKAGQLNDISASQASADATVVERQESQAGFSGTIESQETVSQSMHGSAQASAASVSHESISASATDQSQISSVDRESVIPFVKDSIHLGSSIAAGAASTVVNNVLGTTRSQTIGIKQDVLPNYPSESACESIVNSEVSTAAQAGSVADGVLESSAQAASSVLVKTGSTFVEPTSVLIGSPHTVIASHPVVINSVPAVVGAEVDSTNSAVGSLANVAQQIIQAKEGLVSDIEHVPKHVIVDSGLSSDCGYDRNPIQVISGDVIYEPHYPVNLPAQPKQYIGHDPSIGLAIETNTFIDSKTGTEGQAQTTLLTDESVISSADASSQVSVASSGAAVGSVHTANQVLIDNNIGSADVAGSIAQSSAVVESASAFGKSGISVGSAVHSTAGVSASAVETSETSLGSKVHSAAGASASAVETSEISLGSKVHSAAGASASAVQTESTLANSAHIISTEQEIVNDYSCDHHSVNVNTDAIIQAKGNAAIHSTVENVQQIHSSAISQETNVAESSASSEVVQEHNHAVHFSDVESCEDAGSINIQQGTVVGSAATASAISSAHVAQASTELTQSDQHSAMSSSSASISAQQSAATTLAQETIDSSAHAESEIILANQGLVQSGVEVDHVITNAGACESSSNFVDQAVVAGSNQHTGVHVIVNSNSGLANVHSHAVGSISEVSSQSTQINEEHVQSSAHSASESASSQSAASASAIASAAVIDQSISSSTEGIKGHTIQLDDDYAGSTYLNHGLGNSQSQIKSQAFASAYSLANSNGRSGSKVGHKLTQINKEHVQSAAHSASESASSQSAASASAIASAAVIDQSISSSAGGVKGYTIQLDDDYDGDSAGSIYLGHGLGNSQSKVNSQTFASTHSSVNSNAQSSSQAIASEKTEQVNVATAASASSEVVASEQDLIQSTKAHDVIEASNINMSPSINAPCDIAGELIVGKHTAINSNMQDNSHSAIAISSASANVESSISSSLAHTDSVASSVASSVAESSVNSIAEADSRVSAAKTVIDSTVNNVNQAVIGSHVVDADDCLIANAPTVQDADIVIINSESGIVKAADSSSAAAQSSSSTSQSSSSVIESDSSVSGVSSHSAKSNVAASAESVIIGTSVQNNNRMNSNRNLYAGAKASLTNDYATRDYEYNYGKIPVHKIKVPAREVYIIENDPRNMKRVNIKDYVIKSGDKLKEAANEEILESAIDKGSKLVEQVINDAAMEYNMNENTAFKEKIVDLAVKTVKKLVADVSSEAARKMSNTEVAMAGSELKIDKSAISNSGFDYVDTRRIEKCPWRDDWNQKNLHDYGSYRNRPHLHENGYLHSGYNDNSNRFKTEQSYRNEREICSHAGDKSEDKFLDNLYFDGKIHHFEYSNKNSMAPETRIDTNKLYNLNLYDNTRFIDLDLNCSDKSMATECKRLDYSLKSPNAKGSPIPLRFIKTHLSHGHDLAIDMQDRAKWLISGGFQPKRHTASMLHFLNNKVKDSTVKIHEESELTLFAAKLLQDKLFTEYKVTPNTFLEFLHSNGFRITGDRICRTRFKRCNSLEKYRSFDGSCNNLYHPRWGQVNTGFTRVVPPRYSDEIHGVPVSVTGDELPNVRELSVHFFPHRNISAPDFTLAHAQWGQILAHDFAHQIMDQTTNGGIECCSSNGHEELPKSLQHHSCMPIIIPPRDKFYSKYGQRCMNFVRSMTVPKDDCTLGSAEQLNGVTSYLDCSLMYGSDKNTCDSLRVFNGGLMKTEKRQGHQMMPTTTERSLHCDIMSPSEVCYKSGDVRVNQNPHLVIIHTLLVREHNRVAHELSKLNVHWSDERIFQEVRKIVIAEYQHITYTKWLPLLLGEKYCKEYRIIPIESEMSTDYDPRVNPAVINGFTTGAFRFFHSMVAGHLNLCPMDRRTTHTLRLSNHFFRPQIVERSNNFDDLIRGLITQRMMQLDRYFDSELTQYLFKSRNEYGFDLESVDIQRSRDHGLQGYNAYRKICHLKHAKDFDDLIDEIPQEYIEKLRNIYAHVDDIDLLIGGALERPVAGGILGPTVQCLVSEQFYRSRVADRHFYNNANFPHSFTEEQYQEIKKASLARLICDNSDDLTMIQPDVFKVISRKNPLVPCSEIPKLNLRAWQEQAD